MNSAMDRVGLPAYGPDLVGGKEGWPRLEKALAGLPAPLRSVWLQAATAPVDGAAVLNIDRRKISIETKRVLERIPGLQFRQGFVTDLRVGEGFGSECGRSGGGEAAAEDSDGGQPAFPGASSLGARIGAEAPGPRADRKRDEDHKPAEDFGTGLDREPPARNAGERWAGAQVLEVETIFGEVFRADAVVVAVGLSMGGEMTSGDDVVSGGRYGEPASEGLRVALAALGASFQPVSVEVGPRVSERSARARGWLSELESAATQGNPDHLSSRLGFGDGAEASAVRGAQGRGGPGAGRDPGVERTAADDSRELVLESLLPVASESHANGWSAGYPPAAHWQEDLKTGRMVISTSVNRASAVPGSAGKQAVEGHFPVLSPDGATTGEMYLAPGAWFARSLGSDSSADSNGAPDGTSAADAPSIASRISSVVSGMAVRGLSNAGRMAAADKCAAVWVVGRAGGAEDYAACLLSGLRAAEDVAEWFGITRPEGGGRSARVEVRGRGDAP
jgi:hypothetical protein